MKTTDFLDALKARYELPSDYALQKLLGVGRAQISKYRNGKDFLSETTALRVADLLTLEPGYVLACVAAERARSTEARQAWLDVAGKAAAIVLAVLAVMQFASGGPLDFSLVDQATLLPVALAGNKHYAHLAVALAVACLAAAAWSARRR